MYRRYVLKRLINAVIMYAIILIAISAIFNFSAEKTIRQDINEQIKAESLRVLKSGTMKASQIEEWKLKRQIELEHRNWLDRPFVAKVFYRAYKAFTFQYGNSMSIRSSKGDRSVWKILLEVIPRSIMLYTTQFVIVTIIAVAIGLKMARKPGGFLDRSVSFLALAFQGLPIWWVGMVFLFLFAYTLKIVPSGGLSSLPKPPGFLGFLDLLWHIALPLFTLVFVGIWGSAYYIRQIVLGTMNEDFIMAARARGLSEQKILYKHTLRSAAPPIVTQVLLGFLVSLTGGMIIFEGIFSFPGLGKLYYVALQQNDLAVVMGDTSISIFLFMSGLVILDFIYGLLDPRIKVGGKA
ncbi:MAG: ABC transporter permease [Spirochaetes bacterium]|jgi:peptide/nickel transport system permease protein|nr:ABC transporter permease [Spirochaetota bacterium]MBP8991120.1 ABC transporter permease [Spirochaetota bacterium]NLJ04432.1 ABC transporter permease [Exilispira sp.]HOV45679.1 ABC transporter permease [Exilispira sp.]HQQ19613.1 ABC transporter permease [Exilispira sp.]